jgi:hypothetical protein
MQIKTSASSSSPISRRTLDQLEGEIINLSQQLNVTEYEFLVLIREFDIRQGWKAWLFNNCAEWLNFKCGMSLGTAREKVRVALALYDLPQCSAAFAAGDLSYSKARALSRCANPRNEGELLDYSLRATAAQVETHCHQLRNAQRRQSTTDANQVHSARYLRRFEHDDGSITLSAQLPKETGDLVMKAIEIAAAALESVGGTSANTNTNTNTATGAGNGIGTGTGAGANKTSVPVDADVFFRQQADALVHLAQVFLAGGESRSSTADHYQVMVHVDESALRDDGGKSDLPIESVRRITCDASLVTVVEDEAGNPLNVGRKTRVVSSPMKRALLGRDKCCRFPGCSHDKWLDAHHVMHWADGGDTSMDNTLLLCSAHHRLLHEGGFTIQKNFAGEWYFRNGDGKALPQFPAPALRIDPELSLPIAPAIPDNPSRDGYALAAEFSAHNEVNECRGGYGLSKRAGYLRSSDHQGVSQHLALELSVTSDPANSDNPSRDGSALAAELGAHSEVNECQWRYGLSKRAGYM